VRDLLRGPCRHEGRHYQVDLPGAGPPADLPPILAAALGGPWTIRHIAPLVDRVEVMAGAAIREGGLDAAVLGGTTPDDIQGLIARVRDANPAAPIGLGVFVAVGDGPVVDAMTKVFGGGFQTGLAGPPSQVADSLRGLERYDVDRVTVVALAPRSFDLLAPALF
jgi:hypothetical protein